jgi:hypothetical protein
MGRANIRCLNIDLYYQKVKKAKRPVLSEAGLE